MNQIKSNLDVITGVLVGLVVMLISIRWGITGTAVSAFPAALLVYYIHQWKIKREQRMTKEAYARKVDDIFVYAEDEQDDSVRSRAMEEIHLLKDSQNSEWQAGKLTVIILYYEHNPVEDLEEVVEMPPINPQLQRYLVMAPSFDRYCEVAEEWAHRHQGNAHKAKLSDRWASDWAEAEILKQRG